MFLRAGLVSKPLVMFLRCHQRRLTACVVLSGGLLFLYTFPLFALVCVAKAFHPTGTVALRAVSPCGCLQHDVTYPTTVLQREPRRDLFSTD